MRNNTFRTLIALFLVISISEVLLLSLQQYHLFGAHSISTTAIHLLLVASLLTLYLYRRFGYYSVDSIPAIHHPESTYKYALDQHSIVAMTDTSGKIIDLNDKFCEISGFRREELLGNDHRIINSGTQDKSYWKSMYRSVAKGNIWKDEVMNKAKDGHYYWVDTTIIPLMSEAGKPYRYIAIRTDITQQKNLQFAFEKANKQLIELCQLDQLTGIANRRAYEDRLNIEIQSAQRSGQPLSMLLIDIDDFKLVNDQYGHDTGDQVLKHVANIIKDSVPRATDFVARFGGEEFIILLPSTEASGTFQVAERIHENLKNRPVENLPAISQIKISVSIGISSITHLAVDKELLFKQADKALYQAKNNGKNTTIAFRQES